MAYRDRRSLDVGAGARALALATAIVVGACASTGAGPAPSGPPRTFTAAELYPLDAGWKWAYDLVKDGQTMLALYSVLDRTGDSATVQAGEDQLGYAITPQGIAQKGGPVAGDFIVKNPVAVGTEWPVAGGRARITAVAQSVNVTAGRFDDCVVVEATLTDPPRVARTTFAPGVGPVINELAIKVGGEMTTVTRATLRAVPRPGQDPLAMNASNQTERHRVPERDHRRRHQARG
jgi:hypothetical protein